ncbi:MAG: hypothetical protein ACI4A8_09680 [Muribaculaceae bacterium]
MMNNELTVVYSCYHISGTPVGEYVYYVTFHIKPVMDDFEVYISPHNTYTDEIDITRLESDFAKYRFHAHGSGPVVDCEDLWVEVVEADPKTFFQDAKKLIDIDNGQNVRIGGILAKQT